MNKYINFSGAELEKTVADSFSSRPISCLELLCVPDLPYAAPRADYFCYFPHIISFSHRISHNITSSIVFLLRCSIVVAIIIVIRSTQV